MKSLPLFPAQALSFLFLICICPDIWEGCVFEFRQHPPKLAVLGQRDNGTLCLTLGWERAQEVE